MSHIDKSAFRKAVEELKTSTDDTFDKDMFDMGYRSALNDVLDYLDEVERIDD